MNAPIDTVTLAPAPRVPGRAPLAERILDALPSGSYALAGLLRLMDIVESASVPTAAVECRLQPRQLVNPEFVERHAPTPEKLMMLVLHELHHVLLGHRTLFPRSTPAQNFVFDAVINGLVCRMFPDPAFTAFFTDYSCAEDLPVCLLRPPPAWPVYGPAAPGIAALREPLRTRALEVHRALYSVAGASYKEVFELLPKVVENGDLAAIPLLGGHGAESEQQSQSLEANAPLLFDVVRSIVEQWPQPPEPIRGRSLSEVLSQANVRPQRPPSARAVLRSLIRKVAGETGGGLHLRESLDTRECATPLPTLARRALVQRALGFEPLLHPGEVSARRRRREGGRVHVCLDVSGSTDSVKSALYGAVLDCGGLVEPTVHLFSTEVADVSLAALRRGVCRSTGGTNTACVAEHMERRRVRRALIVTDGWVGTPYGRHRETLARAKLAVAWLGTTVNAEDLAEVANCSATLPRGESR